MYMYSHFPRTFFFFILLAFPLTSTTRRHRCEGEVSNSFGIRLLRVTDNESILLSKLPLPFISTNHSLGSSKAF